MFLRFGKAGWDCVTEGNIFMCSRYFFFNYQSLLQNITPKIRLSKPYFRYSIFFKHIWNSVRFLINVERDELDVRRRKASPHANPVFTPLIKCMTWKIVRVLEGRYLFGMRLRIKRRFSVRECNCCQMNRFSGKAAVSILSESLQLPSNNEFVTEE